MKLPVKTLAEAKLVLYRQRPALDERDPSQKAFYVPRPLDTYADFIDEATAAFKSGSPFRWFFTGHTGAGKSTELNRLTASPELDEHYLPYIYRVLDNLDVNDLQFTDLLLGLAQSIMELARAHKVKIPKTLDTRIADWDKEIEIEREFTGSAAAKAGLEFNLWFAKASTEVQAGGEKKRIIREKMRESITSFIALVDDLAHKVETVRKKKLLIVFDQLDHVPQGPIGDLFANHWASISQPAVSMMFVVPLFLPYEPRFGASIQDIQSLLPNIKVFTGPESKKLDPAGFQFFKDVISRLASLDLFTAQALADIFTLSAGMVRDMIGNAGDACKLAHRDPANLSGKVQPSHVQSVFYQRMAFFRRVLRPDDYVILESIRLNPNPVVTAGVSSLLHLKAVIFFPNGEGWYGLHPAVASILDGRKA